MLALVTGAAGFIGYHVVTSLLDAGAEVVGVDNMNSYDSVALKRARLDQLERRRGFHFHRVDVADLRGMTALTERYSDMTQIIHIAAQAGVRYSLENPLAYVEANVAG